MKKTLSIFVSALFLLAAIGTIVPADKSKVYHVCNCKDDCKCDFVSSKPGCTPASKLIGCLRTKFPSNDSTTEPLNVTPPANTGAAFSTYRFARMQYDTGESL